MPTRSPSPDRVPVVILAGGRGTRLRPYTATLPKALVPLGDRAVLEILLAGMRRQGFRNFILSVGHLAHLIEAYFGDGSRFGVRIRYVRENRPLGTIGPLSLLPVRDAHDPCLALNADLVTDLDFRRLLRHHARTGFAATIAVVRRRVGIDFGVVRIRRSARLNGWNEKPSLEFDVSAGVDVIGPEALATLVPGRPLDRPTFFTRLLRRRIPVGVYLHKGSWLDIGRPEDYETAVAAVDKRRL